MKPFIRWILILLAAFGAPVESLCFADENNTTVRSSPYSNWGDSTNKKKNAPMKRPAMTNNLSVAQLEQHMFESVNRDRVKYGAQALEQSALLGRLARGLADDMVKHDYFGHLNSDNMDTKERARRTGITCGVYENIATQTGPDPPMQMVEEIERSFMAEPPQNRNHRYVLLYPQHRFAGIGVARSKAQLIVQEFTDADPQTSSENKSE